MEIPLLKAEVLSPCLGDRLVTRVLTTDLSAAFFERHPDCEIGVVDRMIEYLQSYRNELAEKLGYAINDKD